MSVFHSVAGCISLLRCAIFSLWSISLLVMIGSCLCCLEVNKGRFDKAYTFSIRSSAGWDYSTGSESLFVDSASWCFAKLWALVALSALRDHRQMWQKLQLIPSLHPLGLFAYLQPNAHELGCPREPLLTTFSTGPCLQLSFKSDKHGANSLVCFTLPRSAAVLFCLPWTDCRDR